MPISPVSQPLARTESVARFAWATLCCNVAVVLWGAYVRATGSGAGCGNKWPSCNGEVLGMSARSQTIIEFTHRMMTGGAIFVIFGVLVWIFLATSKGHPARDRDIRAMGARRTPIRPRGVRRIVSLG